MFNFLHKNISLQWLILLGLVCLTIIKLVALPEMQSPEGAPILYHYIYNVLSLNATLFVVVIGLILFFQILLLQIYFQKNHFLSNFSLFPAIVYLALMNCSHFLTPVTLAFFSNLFIVIVLNLVYDYTKQSVKSQTLLAGICIGIGICIDLSSAILIVFIIISLITTLFSEIKNLFICILGLFTLFIYLGVYYFLTDNIPALIENLQNLVFLKFFNKISSFSVAKMITFSIFSAILLYIVLQITMLYKSRLIVLRKNLSILNILIFCSLLTIFLTLSPYPLILQYQFLPMAVYLTIFTQEKSRFFFKEIIVFILFVVLCV